MFKTLFWIFISYTAALMAFKKSPLQVLILVILSCIYFSIFIVIKVNLKFFLIILLLIFLGGLMVMFSFFISSSFFPKFHYLNIGWNIFFIIFYLMNYSLELNFKETKVSSIFIHKIFLVFLISILLYLIIYLVKLNFIKMHSPFSSSL